MKRDLQKSPASDKIAGMYIWQHKNGSWYINFGRAKNKSLGKISKDIAEKILERKQKEVLEGKLFILEKRNLLLIEDFKKEFLSTRNGHALKTQKADELALKTFIEFFGNRSMAGITEPVMLRYRGHLKMLGLADNSSNNYLRHLKGAIKYALKEGYIPSVIKGRPNDPRDGMMQYYVDHSQKIWMDKEEVSRLIVTAQKYPDMKTVVPVMVFTGIPRQNIVAPLHLTETEIQYRRGKTKKLINVPIHDGLRPYIAHMGTGIHRLADMHPDTLSHKFHAIAVEAKVPDGASAHKLRHTFATLMLEAGVPIEKVSKWLGHSDIRITLEYYAHVIDNDGVAEINKFRL